MGAPEGLIAGNANTACVGYSFTTTGTACHLYYAALVPSPTTDAAGTGKCKTRNLSGVASLAAAAYTTWNTGVAALQTAAEA